MTAWEVLGFATGAVCVLLAVRQNVWTYPVGIANNVAFFGLFLGAGLYADMWLQVFYVGVAVHGWWSWLRGGPNRTHLRVQSAPRWGWPVAIAAVAIGTWVAYVLLTSHTDSTVPVADGLTTSLSVVAQLMLNRKWLANWYVWITADVLYVGLYSYKGLYLTAVLYAGFIGLCLLGLRSWRQAYAAQQLPGGDRGPAAVDADAIRGQA